MIKFKAVVVLFILGIVNFSIVTATFASSVSLNFDGRFTPLNVTPVIEKGTTLVGMREIFNLLGADILWNEKTNQVTATKDDTYVVLTIGSALAKVNDKYISLSVTPRIENGNTLVPIRFLSEVFGYDVSWDPNDKVISVYSQKPQTKEQLENKSTDEIKELSKKYERDITLDEVLEKALSNNSSLSTLADSLSLLSKNRKDIIADINISDYYSETGIPQIYENTQATLLLRLISIDTTRAGAQHREAIIKKATEMGIRNTFTSINNLQADLSLMKEAIALNEINIKNLELKLSLGVESKVNIDKAKIALEQSYKNLAIIEKSIESEFIGLNNLMGITSNEGYNIDFDFDYELFVISDLDEYISRMTFSDPNIKLKEMDLRDADIAMNTHSYSTTDPTSTYDYKRNVFLKAQRDLEDAKLELDKNIRSTYNNLKQLEGTIEAQKLNILKAKDDYNTILIQYATGFVTEYETQLAKLAISDAETTLIKNINSYINLRFLLENPYLLASPQ